MKRMQFVCELLRDYYSSNLGYPPAASVNDRGQEVVSWRFFLAAVRTGHLVDYPDEPWPNSGYERWDTDEARLIFSARGFEGYGSPNPNNETDFLALVGPGTAFTEFCAKKSPGTRKIEPDAILLVEYVSNIHWIQPGDINIKSIQQSTSKTGLGDLKGNYAGCFAVAFVDGAVWFLKDSVPSTEISKLLTVESAEKYDREIVLKDYVIQKMAR